VSPIEARPGARARRRRPRSRSGKVAVDGPTLQPSQKRMYVEKPQPTTPASAADAGSRKSEKKRKAESSARKSVNAQEKVKESGTGSQRPSQVAGCSTPAWAVPRSGLPASTNRFQSGSLPLAAASRTAALHGRFAKARSERIGFAGGGAPSARARACHGSEVA
jgi:hypothetical protein